MIANSELSELFKPLICGLFSLLFTFSSRKGIVEYISLFIEEEFKKLSSFIFLLILIEW